MSTDLRKYMNRLDAKRIEISTARAGIEEIHSELNDITPVDEEEDLCLSTLIFDLEDTYQELDELEDKITDLIKENGGMK